MALSNKFGNMVLSAGNKSEISVGYTTIYGDMNGGFTVLKDAYKTDVYNLASWRNKNFSDFFMGPKGICIPVNSINKEPSAELNIDQKDQDNLPPYDVLDDILQRIIEKEDSIINIVKSGYDEKLVKKIYKLLLMSEYKRRQSTPGVKLTARSFEKNVDIQLQMLLLTMSKNFYKNNISRASNRRNIGSSARAMLNFGLNTVNLVKPRDGWPNRKLRRLQLEL